MEEIDLKELFDIFWKKKIPMLIILLAFIVLGMIYTMKFTIPMYRSSTTLVLTSSADETVNTNIRITATDLTINSKLVATYSELVKSKDILREVTDNLGIQVDEQRLRNHISVNAIEDTELIKITVEDTNPSDATKIANEIAKVFTNKVRQIYNIDNIQIVDEAYEPTEPSNIHHVKDGIIFACMGLVVAIVYVIITNMLDNSIKTAEDIEADYNIPVLASIPRIKKLGKEKIGRAHV